MSMRLSTADVYQTGIASLISQQADLNRLQDQLSTGKRVNRASDDPAAAARAERAAAGMARSETSQRAVDASLNAMTQTEGALHDANDLLQDARETLVQAGDASYSDPERLSLSQKLQAIRNQLLVVANRSDGAGGYLFAGQSSAQQPFTDAPGGVRYSGTAGATVTATEVGMPLTADGAAAWTTSRTGNGVFVTTAGPMVKGAIIDNGHVADPSQLTGSSYSLQFAVSGGNTTYAVLKDGAPTAVTAEPYVPGKEIVLDGMSFNVSGTPASGDQFDIAPSTPTLSVFDTLDKAIADLAMPKRTGPQVAQGVADNLRNIDSVMGTLQATRAKAGDMMQRADKETGRIDTQKLGQETDLTNAQGLDLPSALSAFKTKQTSYDAALQSYSMVQRMSLFDYLHT